MVAVPYSNLFLKARGAGTEVDPAIVQVAFRVRIETGYREIGSGNPLPVYRSPTTVFPFYMGSGNRQALAYLSSGQRYVLDSLFLSSSSGEGDVYLQSEDSVDAEDLGTYPISPRVMGQSISLSKKLLPGAGVWVYPSKPSIVYGGFFLGRIV